MCKVKPTRKNASGTSFFGTTITTTPKKLIGLFPDSYEENNTGKDKTNFDFTLETSSGDVFTIYDWKMYRKLSLDKRVEFHIGGKSEQVTEQAKIELEEIL